MNTGIYVYTYAYDTRYIAKKINPKSLKLFGKTLENQCRVESSSPPPVGVGVGVGGFVWASAASSEKT